MRKSKVSKSKVSKSKVRKSKRKFGKSSNRSKNTRSSKRKIKNNSNIKIAGLLGSGLLASGLYYMYNNNNNNNNKIKIPKIGLFFNRNIMYTEENIFSIKSIYYDTFICNGKNNPVLDVNSFTSTDLFIIYLQISNAVNSFIHDRDVIENDKINGGTGTYLMNILSYIKDTVEYLRSKNLKFKILVDLSESLKVDKRGYVHGPDDSMKIEPTLVRTPSQDELDTHIEKYYVGYLESGIYKYLGIISDDVYYIEYSKKTIVKNGHYDLEKIYKII
jgi:hypothetical protein